MNCQNRSAEKRGKNGAGWTRSPALFAPNFFRSLLKILGELKARAKKPGGFRRLLSTTTLKRFGETCISYGLSVACGVWLICALSLILARHPVGLRGIAPYAASCGFGGNESAPRAHTIHTMHQKK